MVFEHSKEIFPAMTSTIVIKITLLCTVFYNNRCYDEKYRLAVSNTTCNTETSSVEERSVLSHSLIDVNAYHKVSLQSTKNNMKQLYCLILGISFNTVFICSSRSQWLIYWPFLTKYL